MSANSIAEQLRQRIERMERDDFDAVALAVFRYQAEVNPVYASFLRLIGCDPRSVRNWTEAPFLPIELFKSQQVQSDVWEPELVFCSSGTTGAQTSRHYLRDPAFYRRNAERGFAHFYGPPGDYCWLALLPAYLEREGSSLVFMADHFIRQSRFSASGFFLDNIEALAEVLREGRETGIPTVLLGVSFALLDLAERFPGNYGNLIVMETGGMKGRRRELTRAELHARLKQAFGLDRIHSEYGMTELLSQAYSSGDGWFRPSPTMRVAIRDMTDPLQLLPAQERLGAINVVDLANLDTCSFVATEDLGRLRSDDAFEVLGRMDNSDLRGCNLLLEER